MEISNRKIAIYAAVPVVLIIAFFAYLLYGGKNGSGTDLSEAIPANTSLVIDFENIESLELISGDSVLISRFPWTGYKSGTDLLRSVKNYASIKDEEWNSIKGMLGFRPNPNGGWTSICYLDLSGEVSTDNLEGNWKDDLGRSRKFDGHEVIELKREGLATLNYSIKKDILMITGDSYLLDQSLKAWDEGGEVDIEFSASNKVEFAVSLNRLSDFLPKHIKKDMLVRLKEYDLFGDWIVLSPSSDDEITYWSAVLQGKEIAAPAGSFDISLLSSLPASTAMVIAGNFTEANLPGGSICIPEDEDYDLHFKPWIGDGFAFGITPPLTDNIIPHYYLVIDIKDGADPLEHIDHFPIETGSDITKMHTGLPVEIMGQAMNIFNPAYCMVREGVLIVTADPASLSNLQTELASGRKFELPDSDPSNTISNPDLLAWCKPSKLSFLFKHWFNEDLEESEFNKWFARITSTSEYAVSAEYRESEIVMFLSQFAGSSIGSELVEMNWDYRLEDPATGIYDLAGSIRNILVQDINNKLYSLDYSGSANWNIELGSKIGGSPMLIDYYNNGQEFILFNTSNAIHLLNKDGEEVAGFPIELQSEIIQPISVFDYDGNNDYRYFVGCANGEYYGFEKTGKPLNGWNPWNGLNSLIAPIRHIRHKGKDYLYTTNTSGDLIVLNRKGEVRLGPYSTGKTFARGFREDPNKPGTLYNVSSDGIAHRFIFDNTTMSTRDLGFDFTGFGMRLMRNAAEGWSYGIIHDDGMIGMNKNYKIEWEFNKGFVNDAIRYGQKVFVASDPGVFMMYGNATTEVSDEMITRLIACGKDPAILVGVSENRLIAFGIN